MSGDVTGSQSVSFSAREAGSQDQFTPTPHSSTEQPEGDGDALVSLWGAQIVQL